MHIGSCAKERNAFDREIVVPNHISVVTETINLNKRIKLLLIRSGLQSSFFSKNVGKQHLRKLFSALIIFIYPVFNSIELCLSTSCIAKPEGSC